MEKTLEKPLGCKEIKPFNTKVNQPGILIARTDVEAKALTGHLMGRPYWKRPYWERLKEKGEGRG